MGAKVLHKQHKVTYFNFTDYSMLHTLSCLNINSIRLGGPYLGETRIGVGRVCTANLNNNKKRDAPFPNHDIDDISLFRKVIFFIYGAFELSVKMDLQTP